MWYMTLENQIIIFEELPEHLKTKESVLKALKNDRKDMHWFQLPTQFMHDEDIAYACFEQSPFYIIDAQELVSRDGIWKWVFPNLSRAA